MPVRAGCAAPARPRGPGRRPAVNRAKAPAASLIHFCSILASSPDALSSSIAADTHPVSEESFSSSAPPLVAAGRLELADDLSVGHLHRGQVSAVGRSTTTASTWPCLSAVTTSFESLNTCGSVSGAISASTASRLVVPTWTPIVAPVRSSTEPALAASESFAATTAWLAV